MTQLLVGLLWAAVLLVSPALASADQATYLYDDLGRLSQVIDGQRNVARDHTEHALHGHRWPGK